MIINSKTKISNIIKYDKKVIDVIASVNKHFKKLKNPILCKMFASRVNVGDAARIGGITTEEFLEVLEHNGYSVEYSKKNNNEQHDINNRVIIMDKKNVVELDVRPILAGGTDPFDKIMTTLKTLEDNQTLLVINTFEPVPLLNLLKKKGYGYMVERPKPSIVYAYIYKNDSEKTEGVKTNVTTESLSDFESVAKKFEGKMQEIDVRDLEMPMPMVSILETIEKLGKDEALYVHHKKLPRFLLPELETRGFKLVKKEIGEGNLKLIIFK